MTYRAKEFSHGLWHVIDSTGQPIYDGAPEAKDKPAIFRDPDAADECAARLNRDAQSAETKCVAGICAGGIRESNKSKRTHESD